ncbi:hypothetical protein BBJ28_00023111 [Nothophytophthora sp. Chile5]|nr:hypothetical protein BBJ28_00023111 [Nothophytophthora sp. Chile5]
MATMSARSRWKLQLLVLTAVVLANPAVALASNATQSPLSGCQTCAESGDCLHAYLGAPGQFCGNWLDRASQRQRCCCPRDAKCELSNYACNCRASSGQWQQSEAPPARWETILGSVGLLFVGASVLWCLCPCCRANQYAAISQPMSPVLVQGPPIYASGYSAPGYSHGYNPGYGGYPNNGMGAGSSAMLGGTAGFFGGMFAGRALASGGGGGGYGHHSFHGGGGGSGYASGGNGEQFSGDF